MLSFCVRVGIVIGQCCVVGLLVVMVCWSEEAQWAYCYCEWISSSLICSPGW